MKNILIVIVIVVIGLGIYLGYRAYYPKNSTTSTTIETTSVSIEGMAFNPSNISVTAGQTVTFTNKDSVSHTVTADDNSFDSGTIAPGQSYTKQFDTTGTFSYHCSIHPSMKGSVEVK